MKKLNDFPTKKSTKFVLILFFFVTIILSVMTGCDDKDSSDAKLFQAKQALDNGQWKEAQRILLSLSQSDEVLQYLSNAYAGEAGINTFDILTTIDELEGEESGSIDMIGKLIGDENDVLTVDAITEKLATINKAIDSLNQIDELNDDQKVQLGLASITRTTLITADLIAKQTGEPEVTMTEEWITGYRNDNDGLVIDQDTWTSDSYAEMLNDDITNVDNAASAMSGDNDIKEDFEDFKEKIDNGTGGTSDDDSISLGELNNYIAEM